MRKWRERIVIAFMLALGVLGLVVYVALFYAVIPYKIVTMLEDMAKSTVTMVTNSWTVLKTWPSLSISDSIRVADGR